jgi:hypothetical protein
MRPDRGYQERELARPAPLIDPDLSSLLGDKEPVRSIARMGDGYWFVESGNDGYHISGRHSLHPTGVHQEHTPYSDVFDYLPVIGKNTILWASHTHTWKC